jgi:hypothetical protein
MQENKVQPSKDAEGKNGRGLTIAGLMLILSAVFVVWYFRSTLMALSPLELKGMWMGMGGIALIFLVAALPLGALLLALGLAKKQAGDTAGQRGLLVLGAVEVLYFVFHAIMAFRYSTVPFVFFALSGLLVVGLFIAGTVFWARRRAQADAARQRALDYHMAAGLCFVNSAWQTCGLLGVPGFALYTDLVEKLNNHSFITGQAVAIQVFTILGFLFLLLAMRAEPAD